MHAAMNPMKNRKLITFVSVFLLALPVIADVRFNFIFEEEFTKKKLDPEFLEYIKGEFDEVGKVLGSYLNHDQSVDIFVSCSDNSFLETSIGLIFDFACSGKTIRPEFCGTVIGEKIQYGIDLYGGAPDVYMLFNPYVLERKCHLGQCSGELENYGDYKECDEIKRRVLRAIIRALGITGTFNFKPTGTMYPGDGIFSKYDYYIQDANGIPLWERKFKDSSASVTEPGYFVGPNAKATFFGLPVPLPMLPQYKHCDYYAHSAESFLFIDDRMDGSEEEPLRLSATEIAILEDIGFKIHFERAARTDAKKEILMKNYSDGPYER